MALVLDCAIADADGFTFVCAEFHTPPSHNVMRNRDVPRTYLWWDRSLKVVNVILEDFLS